MDSINHSAEMLIFLRKTGIWSERFLSCPWKKSSMTFFHLRHLQKSQVVLGCRPPPPAAGTLSTAC